MAQVLLQEQQIHAEVIVEGRHHAQRAEAWQHFIRPQEVGALVSWSESGIHNQRGEKHIHDQIDLAEQAEDTHCYQLTLHSRRDRAVVLQQARAQLAGELIRGCGQSDVVAKVDTGQHEDQEGQASAHKILDHEASGEALGLQILFYQRVFEATLSYIQSTVEEKGKFVRRNKAPKSNMLQRETTIISDYH